MRAYKILSWQTGGSGRMIYTLLPEDDRSVRIVVDRQESWRLDGIIHLDPAFVLESLET